MVAAMVVILLDAGCESGVLIDGLPPPEKSTHRIVGGQTFTGLPAVGLLLNNGNLQCTATVIGPRKVLTASHCVAGLYPSGLDFLIGTSINSAQSVLQVVDAKAHPNFSFNTFNSDIAYVTLAQDAPVQPMGVLSQMDSSWVGRDLLHVGYGNTSTSGGGGKKRAAWMPIHQVSSTTFVYGGGGKNTCNGDSGGPAFFEDSSGQYLVAGVTSHGDPYCSQFAVDTRVDKYLSFLGVSGSGGTTPQQPTQDPCQGETYKGRCDGDTVIWCENNQVMTEDCQAFGQTCQYDSQQQYYACGPPSTPGQPDQPSDPNDPCQGETSEGRCDGDTLIRCEAEQIKSIQCDASAGMTCGLDQATGIYTCITNASPEKWIGESCDASSDCSTGMCLTTDYPGGMCTQSCTKLCPDSSGKAATFCVALDRSAGYCYSRCDYNTYSSGCRSGYECVNVPRHNDPGITHDVCFSANLADQARALSGDHGTGSNDQSSDTWIGGACQSDANCAANLFCETDEHDDGMCTRQCPSNNLCPDREGEPITFCVALDWSTGYCYSRCDYDTYSSGCRSGYICKKMPRHEQCWVKRNTCIPQSAVGKADFLGEDPDAEGELPNPEGSIIGQGCSMGSGGQSSGLPGWLLLLCICLIARFSIQFYSTGGE
jgi:hypothetical protein